VARTPAFGNWPGSEGSGGAKTVPMQCSVMSCGATPMCVARNGCGELPRRRPRYKLRCHCRRCCTTPRTGSHTAWMVSVVGTIQQSAARCPTAHSFAPQLHLRPAAEQMAFWIKNSTRAPDPSTRPSDPFSPFSPRESTPDPRNQGTASTPDPRASGREVKRACVPRNIKRQQLKGVNIA